MDLFVTALQIHVPTVYLTLYRQTLSVVTSAIHTTYKHKLVLLKIFDRGTKRALTSVSALDFPLDNNSFSSQRIPVGYSPSVFFPCQRDLTAVVSSFIYINSLLIWIVIIPPNCDLKLYIYIYIYRGYEL
jgi:hypothetical protein